MMKYLVLRIPAHRQSNGNICKNCRREINAIVVPWACHVDNSAVWGHFSSHQQMLFLRICHARSGKLNHGSEGDPGQHGHHTVSCYGIGELVPPAVHILDQYRVGTSKVAQQTSGHRSTIQVSRLPQPLWPLRSNSCIEHGLYNYTRCRGTHTVSAKTVRRVFRIEKKLNLRDVHGEVRGGS